MANTASAKKAVRKIEARTIVGKSRKSRVKTYLNIVREALTEKNYEQAHKALQKAESETMRAVSKGVLHMKTGSRKISRLSQQVKKLKA